MKRMLFNATQQEELRVAIVDGQKLIDIDIETTGREQRKSNIYKGVITRIEPSLEACFVNYGEERHGFLPFKEVARSYFKEGVDVRHTSIKEALREGQEIMIQVEKEERGNKGAALTSFISLAGRYLVLMPNNPRGGGVSRRVEGEERQELRETMDKLDLPSGMSVIARTAGIGRSVEELQWDLNYLMQLWRAIEGAGQSAPGAFLIYQESSLVIRAIRDYFQPDIGEILIDTDDIFEQAQQFMSHVMPDMVHRVKRYRDDVPLFSRFQIEHQIETAYSRTVPLPSGGAIVIDHTEALVSIDVNSARATRGSDIETTALNTNLEAADEVARQLRLRDLGGLIVIDFIDMENAKNQREVETRLKDALRYDRARVQMGKISRFGLMELSRQRLRPSLSEGSHVTCPRCNGTGHIRDTESSALQVLRIIQEEAMKENSAAIHVQAPVDVAAFLLNEKRGEILKIENRHRVNIVLIPNKHLETPHYKLERIKHDDPRLEEAQASYDMAEQADTDISYGKRHKEEIKPRQEAMVKGITPAQPAPVVERKPVEPVPGPAIVSPVEQGFFSRMFGFFRKKTVAPVAVAPVVEEKPQAIRERTERNARSPRGRGRGRGGRERIEERDSVRTEVREEPAKQLPIAAVDAQAVSVPARTPRTGRENNEGRRERNSNGTHERPSRQREERKESITEEAVVEPMSSQQIAVPSAAAASFTPSLPNSATDVALSSEAPFTEEVASEQNEERRRRRRRGGRNRNRRDRETSETIEVHDEVESLEASFVSAPASSNAAPQNAIETIANRSSAELAGTATSDAISVSAVNASTMPIVQDDSPAAKAVLSNQTDTSSSLNEAISVETQAIEASTIEQIIVQLEPTSTKLSEITAAPTATTSISSPTVSPIKPEPMQLETLREILAAAGLTLAVTNPEKLKAAQEAAARVVPLPRVPRERKPLPPLSTEPLIQVETRRQAL